MHKRNRSVKILATLGPASSEVEQIKELHLAGADVFRINMSHGDPEKMRAMMAKIREVEADVGSTIGILVDIQGPKLRVGMFADDAVMLENGASSASTPKTNRAPWSACACRTRKFSTAWMSATP
jgi:pyruvate kinase